MRRKPLFVVLLAAVLEPEKLLRFAA